MSMNGELRQITPDQVKKLGEKRVVEEIMASEGLSLNKLWNALHFVLCGDGFGESAALDGVPLMNVDNGFGPPMYLRPEEVADYADQLAEMTEDELRQNFDREAMGRDNVYVIPDDADELIDLFGQLRGYYQDAAKKDHGMLIFLA